MRNTLETLGNRVRIEFFGDSYDVVKRFLLATLDADGMWAAFPMFTHEPTRAELVAFESFVGVRVLDPLALPAPRVGYFGAAGNSTRLLLDPDTGVRLDRFGGKASASYVFADEVVDLSHALPGRMTVVFDQSYSRAEPQETQLRRKLVHLSAAGVTGFAYLSHASFLVLSSEPEVLCQARQRLTEAHLPETRLVDGPGL